MVIMTILEGLQQGPQGGSIEARGRHISCISELHAVIRGLGALRPSREEGLYDAPYSDYYHIWTGHP